VLYISHRLAEVRQLCARGTVLRNGETISTMELAQARDADIFRLMVGGSLAGPDSEPARRPSAPDAGATPGIKVTDLTGRSVRGVSFEIARGEIVGVAALEGQGQRELFRMLAGLERAVSGAIEADGLPIQAGSSVSAFAKNAGVGFVPEERKTEGLFPGLKTAANISLPAIGKLARLGFVSGRREYSLVSSEARRVDLEDRYLPMKITALSGGNQQKALIGRVLLSGARHLVLFDPTRGVDVATKQVIYRIIRQFAAAGGSVLIYSTELAELTRLADRCLVLYRGAISGELSSDALTESGLVALATGHALEAAE
jgi:ribose transport system ATP-binding protein